MAYDDLVKYKEGKDFAWVPMKDKSGNIVSDGKGNPVQIRKFFTREEQEAVNAPAKKVSTPANEGLGVSKRPPTKLPKRYSGRGNGLLETLKRIADRNPVQAVTNVSSGTGNGLRKDRIAPTYSNPDEAVIGSTPSSLPKLSLQDSAIPVDLDVGSGLGEQFANDRMPFPAGKARPPVVRSDAPSTPKVFGTDNSPRVGTTKFKPRPNMIGPGSIIRNDKGIRTQSLPTPTPEAINDAITKFNPKPGLMKGEWRRLGQSLGIPANYLTQNRYIEYLNNAK